MMEFAKSIAVGFWATVLEMSPYLLFGFFVAGLLSVLVSKKLVERHLGGRGIGPVIKAALFGVPMPLCSCSVIPVTMSLHKHGASKAASVSFLLSTPQTGAENIFVVYSLLGPLFAVFCAPGCLPDASNGLLACDCISLPPHAARRVSGDCHRCGGSFCECDE